MARDRIDEYGEPIPAPPRNWFSLPVVLSLGFLIWKLTAQPGLAAAFMCLKFGWEDFTIARWLRRTDPIRPRGKGCFWLYVSSGLWKTAIMATIMVFVIAFYASAQQKAKEKEQREAAVQPPPVGPPDPNPPANGPKPPDAPPPIFVGAMLTAFFSLLFSCLSSYFAIWYGLRHNLRFWLNGALRFAVQRDEWPPLYGRQNWVSLLLLTTAVLTCFVVAPIGLIFAIQIVESVGIPLRPPVKGGLFVVTILFLVPVMVLVLRETINHRFVAAHPVECWGEDPLPRDLHSDYHPEAEYRN